MTVILFSCGGEDPVVCTSHVDADANGKCDTCGADVETPACTEHTDADNNGACDKCGAEVEVEVTPCETCIDVKNDGTCDVCSSEMTDGKLQYTVYITDEYGNPVEGVQIQICVGDSCLSIRDYKSDANGRFTRRVTNSNNDTVKIIVAVADEIYEYDPTVYVASFEEGSYELDLVLKKK